MRMLLQGRDGGDRFLAYAEQDQKKPNSNNKAGIKVIYNLSTEERKNFRECFYEAIDIFLCIVKR